MHSRPQQRSWIVIVGVAVAFAGACAGDDGSSIPPGKQDFVQPPGSTTPAETTSVTCSQSDPCDYWYCACADGAVVNGAYCYQGLCAAAGGICPAACAAFGHGEWTGNAGGGPSQDGPRCGGLGSSGAACNACFSDACCAQGDACGSSPSCLDHWDCVVACGGNASCRASCEDRATASGLAAYEALEGCLLDNCATECGPT